MKWNDMNVVGEKKKTAGDENEWAFGGEKNDGVGDLFSKSLDLRD